MVPFSGQVGDNFLVLDIYLEAFIIFFTCNLRLTVFESWLEQQI
jgi:hypothetical protein